MRDLSFGNVRYLVTGSDAEIALAHAIGIAFIELQQLEFAIISYLSSLADEPEQSYDASFDVFSSKTFGNLIREMDRHDFLKPLAIGVAVAKQKRDFFIHKFLFHRYGGIFTSDEEYEELARDATNIGNLFALTHKNFVEFMLQKAPLSMFAAKRDPATGELIVVESEFSKTNDKCRQSN